MASGTTTYRECLRRLASDLDCRFAQWIVEDNHVHDYNVIASVIDAGSSYDVAHRTGVIGQVFRTTKPILALNLAAHPLYDSFDSAVQWELAVPVNSPTGMDVVNLEGTHRFTDDHQYWEQVCRVVSETTGCELLSRKPEPDATCLVQSRLVRVPATNNPYRENVRERAAAIARSGQSTLLVGNYPDLLARRTPAMSDAYQLGVGVSSCFHGLDYRLDLLATGSITDAQLASNFMNWWDFSMGRYACIVVPGGVTDEVTHSRP